MGSNVNLGSFGVTMVKNHFHLKCYSSSMLHSMTIRLIHVDQFETSTYVMMGSNVNLGLFWVTGVKKSFSLKKCCNLSLLHSTTIRLIHVDQLGTLNLCFGVKYQSGLIWGHWGLKFIFTKML